jgi:hypothetical protein
MDIKVGNYIRTKNKGICKIHHINEKATVNKYWVNPDYDDWCTVVKTTEIVKHSQNIIDLIEDEDIVILEYKTPRYQERITRKFEISKIEEYINFENKHCSFWCKVGDKKIVDNICKNIKIKSIVTKEQFKNVMYEV